jgi:hypothetical protein
MVFDTPVPAIEYNNSQVIEKKSNSQGPSDEPDEEEREQSSEWDQETENYFKEVSDELHRQLTKELDDAIQMELDAQMEEEMRKYFEREQEKLQDEQLARALDAMLGFHRMSRSHVTVADVDATITQVVKDYLGNQTHDAT